MFDQFKDKQLVCHQVLQPKNPNRGIAKVEFFVLHEEETKLYNIALHLIEDILVGDPVTKYCKVGDKVTFDIVKNIYKQPNEMFIVEKKSEYVIVEWLNVTIMTGYEKLRRLT
jgi:hypothetical protein